MATMDGKDLWDPSNTTQQEIMCHSENKAELLNKKRGELVNIVQLDTNLFAYLRQLNVVSQPFREELEAITPNAAKVDQLLTYLERNPLWKVHAFFRACALAKQTNVIGLVGLDKNAYQNPLPPSKSEIQGKQHYYRRAGDNGKRPIPNEFIQAIKEHCESMTLNIMETSLFNFKDPKTDIIDLKLCHIDVKARYKKNQREWPEIKKIQVFQGYEDGPAPRTIRLEALPGEGKSTFLCDYAYTWSKEFIECCKDELNECAGHDWMLILHVGPRDMNTGDMRQIIAKSLKCRGGRKKKVLDYIIPLAGDDEMAEECGDGVLLEYDAEDEVQSGKAKKRLKEFVKENKEIPGVRVIVASRSGQSDIPKDAFNRVLKLNGFSIDQGLDYFRTYLEKIHEQREKDKQEFVEENAENIAFVLRNPLLNHMFSELVAKGILEEKDLSDLTPFKVLHSLECHKIRRDSVEGEKNEQHSHHLYRLCLECLILEEKEIPEEMLTKCQVDEKSPYHGFMKKGTTIDEKANDVTSYTFFHQVIFEYFAAAGLFYFLKDHHVQDLQQDAQHGQDQHDEVNKKAVLLTLCAKPKMWSVLELTCGYICYFKEDIEQFMESIIKISTILQCPISGPSEITKLRQPRKGLLSTDLEANDKLIVEDTWTKIHQSSAEDLMPLKKAECFCSHLDANIPTESVSMGDISQAADVESCVGNLKLIARRLLSETMKYESHFFSHLMRCLKQVASIEKQRDLFQKTLGMLLPSHRSLSTDQSVYAYAVGDMRWALVSETMSTLHVNAACPADMIEAFKAHTPRHDGKTKVNLTFESSNDWWKDVHDQLGDDGIRHLLREIKCKFGSFKAMTLVCGEGQVLSGFLKCMLTPEGKGLLPRCLIFSGGQVHLDDLKSWQNCPNTFQILMDKVAVQLPEYSEKVITELKRAIPGLKILDKSQGNLKVVSNIDE